MRLRIDRIAAPRSFVFIWAGSGGCLGAKERAHLQDARELLKGWGFRRCEDICWIKCNRHNDLSAERGAALRRVKEHCLMGIKGGLRRNTDGDVIHANIDTDVIVSRPGFEPSDGSTDKPEEMVEIIERCVCCASAAANWLDS